MTQYNNLINGQWTAADSYSTNTNPSDLTDVIGEYAQGNAADVQAAIAAATAAFPAWSTSGIQARHDALDKIGNEILARKEELGDLLAREEGKTRPEAIGEVGRAGQIFKFFAGECLRLAGETLPSVRPGIGIEITREPIGVVGLITPWNFPIAIPAWKIAPALAFGNCVVLKPADLVPGSAWALADIIHRSGIPAGVFNLVMGPGRVIGDALVRHPDVAAVSFTGSVGVGRGIAQACVETGKKVQLEMGGKNPLIVLADADLDQAVDCALQGSYFSTGQRCTASSRLIVESAVHDAFVARLTQRLVNLKVGHALTRGTEMGPVVDGAQLEQNLSYMAIGADEGAQHVWGGERLDRETPGHYMSPALWLAEPGHRIAREEIFGPIACVLRADGYEHALALANDTPFGLCAGLCTTSLKHAMHFRRHAQAGMTMVNLPTAGVDFHVPFGGRKDSSHGSREQGRYAAEFYTTVKTSYMLA